MIRFPLWVEVAETADAALELRVELTESDRLTLPPEGVAPEASAPTVDVSATGVFSGSAPSSSFSYDCRWGVEGAELSSPLD